MANTSTNAAPTRKKDSVAPVINEARDAALKAAAERPPYDASAFEDEDKKIEMKLYEKIFTSSDENAKIVGEFGIGTNNYAKLTGNLLEDEKVYGTAHLAFGDNINMGGKNKSKIHIDMIFKDPKFD